MASPNRGLGPDREARANNRRLLARFPSVLVFLAICLLYRLISDRLTHGSAWFLVGLVATLLLLMGAAEFRNRRLFVRGISVGITALLTLFVWMSTAMLVAQSLQDRTEAKQLLYDSGVLWIANVLVFGLWYWQIDGGGPDRRTTGVYESGDFVFPQHGQDGGQGQWIPGLVDYLFLAFTTATAFSPTDTAVLSKRAKLLLMAQATVSLMCISILAARAINTL